MILLALACATPDDGALEPARLARRTSLDLRGVLPSAEELDAVEADPTRLASLRTEWMDDPRFEDRLVHLLQERWFTRVDTFDITWYDYGLREEDAYTFARAVGDEPLRLVARVVRDDLPWWEVVTADWTMAEPTLGAVWPIDRTEGEGWQVAQYTDGRPAAGVLATNGLWWRYTTNESNMNRGRAAAASRLLLCEDPLSRPVSLSLDGSTVVDPSEAARTNPSCLTCHASLDPLAANLFGFWWLNMYSSAEETSYHPERERLYSELGVEPGYFGTPIDGLSGLGAAMANDSRLYRCAVESFAEGFWRRTPSSADFDTIEGLRAAFVEADARPRGLIEAILDTPAYTAAYSPDDPAQVRADRLLTPDQLASAVEDLTGFRWTWAGADRLDEDTSGFRVLAGGVDGASVFGPQREPGLTWALVVARLAEAAGGHAASTLGTSGLLANVSSSDQPGDPSFTAMLDALHWRLYATRPDDAWRDEVTGLWRAVEPEGAAAAWTAVVSAMLRDPAFVTE